MSQPGAGASAPVELAPTLTEWILAALVGPSDETVERDRHVAGGVRHRRPLGLVCDLQVATAPWNRRQATIVKPPGPATPGLRAKRNSRPERSLAWENGAPPDGSACRARGSLGDMPGAS